MCSILRIIYLIGLLCSFGESNISAKVRKFYEECLIRIEAQDRCCRATFSYYRIVVRSCRFSSHVGQGLCSTKGESSISKGCKQNHMPDAGFAYPLGMQSGKIKKSQLSSYQHATQESLTKARLFGPEGWRPHDSYFSPTMSVTGTSLSSVLGGPIFYEIKFERKHRISYFIIQDSNLAASKFSQSFYIAYNDSKEKIYGGSVAKELECQYVFGDPRQDCRHILSPPFYAYRIRVVAKNYNTNLKPKWRIEFGGFYYLEAVHKWSLDKILFRNGKASLEIPDERGGFVLSTSLRIPRIDLPVATATGIEYAGDFKILAKQQNPTASFTATDSRVNTCFFNPSLCVGGLTFCLWIQTQEQFGSLFATADASSGGFNVEWTSNYTLRTVLQFSNKQWVAAYTIPKCRTINCTPGVRWLYLCGVWNKADLKLFVNGRITSVSRGTVQSSSYDIGSTLSMENLLLIRDVQFWDYELPEDDVLVVYNESTIDFTITAFDDTGEWKVGIGCTETNGTGPCADQSVSHTPVEDVGPLRYRGHFVDSSVYADYKCFAPLKYKSTGKASADHPYGVAITMGFTVRILDDFNYEQMESFKIYFKASSRSTPSLSASIYAASSYNFDGNYQISCGMRNFRRDLYYGPVSWSTGSWESGTIYNTPDLMEIVRPLFDRGTLVWRKYFFIIFEWTSSPGSTISVNLQSKNPYYIFLYKDNSPDKYLYADATLAPHSGYPLIYTTKPFVPVKKCLSFWYHMLGNSIGILSVSLKQEPSIFKEVFRLYGEQGDSWQRAEIPITDLDESSFQFQVIFTAIRGATTVGDIAIDTIKLSANQCDFMPSKALTQTFNADTFERTMLDLNISLPRLLLPMDSSHAYFSDQSFVVLWNTTHRSLISDMFGFPLANGYFNGSAVRLQTNDKMQNDSDFTISFHVRPQEIKASVILWTGHNNTLWLEVWLSSDGKLSIGVNIGFDALTYRSSITLNQSIWSYIAIVYSRRHHTLTIYVNSTERDRFLVSNLIQSPQPLKILVGGRKQHSTSDYFQGHISCVLFYDSALDLHVIKAFQLCPSKHVANACNPRCQADGICDQITRKCICPPTSSKYVNDDCSNALRSSLYNSSSMYIDFDSRTLLENALGHGAYYKDVVAAENDSMLNSIGSYFSTTGPANLAMCTTSDAPVHFKAADSNCIVSGTCNIKYSLSFWTLLPSKNALKSLRNFTLLRVGPLILTVERNIGTEAGNMTSLFSIHVNVSFLSQSCKWKIHSDLDLNGVWTHYVISIDSTTKNMAFYENGHLQAAYRTKCFWHVMYERKLLLGGMPLVCYDEFSLWERSMAHTEAEGLYNAIAFSGYKKYPDKNITFDRLSYSEKLHSLWALSTEGNAFVYHPGQYWIKVSGSIKSISAGQYGIWAVDFAGQLLFRKGVNASHPEGTDWLTVTKTSYKSKLLRVVSDGFSGVMFIIVKNSFKLFCMNVNENGEVTNVADTSLYVSDIACSNSKCCGYKLDGRTYCFNAFTCGSKSLGSTKQQAYSSSYISTDRLNHWFRLSNGSLYRYLWYTDRWDKISVDKDVELKSILSLNGQPIVVTSDGKLKMIGSGDGIIKVIHSGGYCLRYNGDIYGNKYHIRLVKSCELFKIEKYGCIRHLQSQRFLSPVNFQSGYYSILVDECKGNAMGYKREDNSTISKSFLHMSPFEKKPFPVSNHGVFLYKQENIKARSFEFYFVQASPFKRINSFYPKKAAKDSIKGEVVIYIVASFRFRDLQYVYNFRDRNGIEATSIAHKIETEVKQIFAESNSFIKSEYYEIGYGEEIKFSCSITGGCYKPFEVKFKGSLYFSYISMHEKNILASDKFNGTSMDSENNEYRLNLDHLYRKAYLTPSNITLIKKTESSFLFQFQPPDMHGAHIGYLVWLNGSPKSSNGGMPHSNNYTLRDGLLFNISSLFPYFAYRMKITPLELQNLQGTTVLEESTLESVPSSAPSMHLLGASQNSCSFHVSGIPNENWNGRLLGYHFFYAEEFRLPKEKRLSFNVSDGKYYKNMTINSLDIAKQVFKGLNVYTKYIFYMGGFTGVGMGQLTRIECTTDEGPPEEFKQNITASSINSTHALIRWLPFPDNLWNTGNNNSRGYKIFIEEISFPKFWNDSAIDLFATHPSGEIVVGPLEEDRMYGIQIAAMNNRGDGVKSKKICMRMNEGVPNATIDVVLLKHNTSTSLSLIVGEVKLRHENGMIMYYNISLLSNSSGEKQFHIATIYDTVHTFDILNRTALVRRNAQRNCSSDTFHVGRCYVSPIYINETSELVNITISNLTYWTQYEVQASACTCVGCGPFSAVIYAKTDEYQPTCSTDKIYAIATSSTALRFTWEPLKINCTNGNLKSYKVFFGSADLFSRMTNFSTEWQTLNGTYLGEGKIAKTTKESILFDTLEKYSNYCIAISGATVKGYGPVSNPVCNLTKEDYPDGPPKNVTILNGENKTVEISMALPESNLRNGVILGYNVYFSEMEIGHHSLEEFNKTVFRKDPSDGITKTSIEGLKPFTWYQFKAVAFTSVGEGNRTNQFLYIQTFEDVPSGMPRNLTISNQTESSIVIQWLQVSPTKLNGIFRRFKVLTNETLPDGSRGIAREYFARQKRPLGSDTNNTLVIANAFHNFTEYQSNKTLTLTFDEDTGIYSLAYIGLRPYSNYSISIAACTNPGCGNSRVLSTRTYESYPSEPPSNLKAQNTSESTMLLLTWDEIPTLKRNGIIQGYVLKWMKLCHFLHIQHPKRQSINCNRVPRTNTSDFKTKFVPSPFLRDVVGNLSSYTHYVIRLAAATSAGVGPEGEVLVFTDDDVPSAAPVVTSAFNTSGRSIQVEWINIPLSFHNGALLGYRVFYFRTEEHNTTAYEYNCSSTNQNVTKCEIPNLELYTNYTITVAGFTRKGVGLHTKEFIVSTGPFVHGNWSNWASWSSCSKSCGGGKKLRTRFCDSPSPWNGGDDCKGKEIDQTACNTRKCSGLFVALKGQDCDTFCQQDGFICNPKLDLKDSAIAFKKAGLKCEDEITDSKWKESYHPAFVEDKGICAGYKSIPASINCNATPPIDGSTRRLCNCFDRADVGFLEWAPWSFCSKSCGGGKQSSKRECSIRNGCSGKSRQTKDCNTTPCPVDGQWSQWSQITECNRTCGYGYQHRYRKCNNPAPAYGGDDCYGPSVERIGGCNPHLCPIHGGWSSWESDGVCNQACGGGYIVQYRYCDNPEPEFGGEYCKGNSNHTRPCNLHKCKGVQVLFWFRFTDFEWNYMYYSMTSSISIKLSYEIQENLLKAYNHAPYVTGIRSVDFRSKFPSKRSRREASATYVVANVAVFYSKSAKMEIMYLQDNVKSTLKLSSLNISELAVETTNILPRPPQNLTGIAISPKTIQVMWSSPSNISQMENVTNYYIFYREYNGVIGQWEARGIPTANTSYNITRLKPKTWYKIRMSASVTDGSGPASDEISTQTLEGAPSEAPRNLTAISTQPSTLYVQWDRVDAYYFNGIPRGYVVKYKHYKERHYHEVRVPFEASDVILVDLKPFTIYVIIVSAYTTVGNGPRNSIVTKTLEGVPEEPPSIIKMHQKMSLDTIVVTWSALSEEKTNGRFRGYKVRLTKRKTAGVDVMITQSSTKEIIVDKYTLKLKINGLLSYSLYEVSICGFTAAGNGPFSSPIQAETCRCPDHVYMNWYESKPYMVKESNGVLSGIFKEIADDMIKKSCSTCNGIVPKIHYYVTPSGENAEKISELQVKSRIQNGYHISFPIFGRSEMRQFMDNHIFIELVRSPGSAMIVNGAIDYTTKTVNAFKSVIKIWPMILIIIFISIVFGILLWSFEQFYNEEFTRGRYFHGMCQGLWWAFVSMTTVGYGDISPRSFPGRIVAMIWTLIGLVLVGILTGALTSTITTLTIPPTPNLYDTNAAVINNSFDHNLAIRRNAKVKRSMQFDTPNDVLLALQHKKVDVALLDAFVAAAQKSALVDMELKVKKVISANTAYGFVLSKEMVRLENDFKSHISSNQYRITQFISNMTNMIEVSDEKPPNIKLFDPKTPAFWMVLKFELSALGVLTGLGIIWTIFRLIRKKGKVSTESARESALVDSLEEMLKQFSDHIDEKLNSLTREHQIQLQGLMNLKLKLRRSARRAGFYDECKGSQK